MAVCTGALQIVWAKENIFLLFCPVDRIRFRMEIIMLDCFKKLDLKKTGIFAAGVLFGTAGVKVLGSKDAKKVYTNCTAAALRAKDCVLKKATVIQENAEDIYAEAQQINEDREKEAQAQEIADEAAVAEEVTE